MYNLLLGYLARLPSVMHEEESPGEGGAVRKVKRCIYTPHLLRATTSTLLLCQFSGAPSAPDHPLAEHVAIAEAGCIRGHAGGTGGATCPRARAIMTTSHLGPLRDRLAAAVVASAKFKQHWDVLLRAAEAYVVLDAPPEERPDRVGNLETMPYDRAIALYAAAMAERDRRVLDRLPLGASRFGGLPDLPPGLAWPEVDGR
jgi:hypothetical protein